jgi:hypothetical protein
MHIGSEAASETANGGLAGLDSPSINLGAREHGLLCFVIDFEDAEGVVGSRLHEARRRLSGLKAAELTVCS